MSKYAGGCSCGEVRYEVWDEPDFSFHCQCRQCQKITGAGHASQFRVAKDKVVISGKLKYYKQKADGGNAKSSGFCSHCGSPILTKTSGQLDMLYINAATLDDPSLFHPQKVVYSSSAQHWDYIDPSLDRI